jgi:hypothetical protein
MSVCKIVNFNIVVQCTLFRAVIYGPGVATRGPCLLEVRFEVAIQ